MIAIIDYGVGNLFSLVSSLKKIGANAVVTDDEKVIKSSSKIILPGVGAFADAMQKLTSTRLINTVKEEAISGKNILGICLGMQLFFEKSYEFGESRGLGILKGQIVPMKENLPQNMKIPHIGWNVLNNKKSCPLFKYINDGDFVYFVHSYYAEVSDDSLIATTDYGKDITAAVAKNNIFGCQFHPEKSGETGLNILKGFIEL